MDIMDIQAVESKLSDVTVTPIPRSQVQNFYNYQQQREQREQQPQIQISAIHHTPRERNVNNEREYGHHGTSSGSNGGGRDSYAKRERDYQHVSNSTSTSSTSVSAAVGSSAAALAALQYTQQLQAQLALLQQQANTIASPLTSRSSCSQGGGNVASSSQSQLKYPQSTSPLSVTQISANITTPLTSTANLPTVSTSAASNGLSKYAQLLAVIEEMGRDIRPTYTGSRSSTERLKRGIVHARILVRECLLETERSARQ